MARKNTKEKNITYENSIKKSNEMSMAKLNQGLNLNQMQLLAYAIYSTQQDGKTSFIKADFEREFNLNKYNTVDAYEDSDKVSTLRFSTEDLENNKFSFFNVFSSIKYDNGRFTFKWNSDFIPHILELKNYTLTDLTIASKFKSGFSWTLYDYLKAHYGNWFKELSKEALMKMFNVEDRVTYQRSTSEFKRGVLDIAIREINAHTELEVWYIEKKIGNKITGFILHWSSGEQVAGATEKQVVLLQEIYKEIEGNMFDYLAVKDIEIARNYIIKAKDIHLKIKKGMSRSTADDHIKKLLDIYKRLENLVEIDGKKRDTSIYYNWLEDVED